VYGIRTSQQLPASKTTKSELSDLSTGIQSHAQTGSDRIVDDLLLFRRSWPAVDISLQTNGPSSGILRYAVCSRSHLFIAATRAGASPNRMLTTVEVPQSTPPAAKRRSELRDPGRNMRFKLSKVATSFQTARRHQRAPNSLLETLRAALTKSDWIEDCSSAMSFGRVFPGAPDCRQSGG